MSETTTKPLGAAEVRALLVRAVREKGAEYVYPPEQRDTLGTCQYAHEGQPACIVGHVLAYAGVDLATADIEGLAAFRVADDLLLLAEGLGLALDAAQSTQDANGTWGEALAAFDKAVGWTGEQS